MGDGVGVGVGVGVWVGVGVGVGVDDSAAAIACISAVVSVENWLIAPTVLMPDWIIAAVAPFLLLVASGPWQWLQSVA